MRTVRDEKNYQEWKKKNDKNYCPFCNKDLVRKEYKYWLILENRFPYTEIASKHYMLAPKRHIKKEDLTEDEKKEFEFIEFQLEKSAEFSCIIHNFPHKQSIPQHLHFHVVKYK